MRKLLLMAVLGIMVFLTTGCDFLDKLKDEVEAIASAQQLQEDIPKVEDILARYSGNEVLTSTDADQLIATLTDIKNVLGSEVLQTLIDEYEGDLNADLTSITDNIDNWSTNDPQLANFSGDQLSQIKTLASDIANELN